MAPLARRRDGTAGASRAQHAMLLLMLGSLFVAGARPIPEEQQQQPAAASVPPPLNATAPAAVYGITYPSCSLLDVSRLPLYTRNMDIIDAKGAPVKLFAANWPAHMDFMLPEGLQHQEVGFIAQQVLDMGFNAVRLTYATQMVDEALDGAGSAVLEALNARVSAPVAAKNSWASGLTRLQIFDRVVQELTARRVAVWIDNHISSAQWCCSEADGNGWFGQKNFDVPRWLRGLEFMAGRYASNPFVVGYSMRNELRNGTGLAEWHQHMNEAISVVHTANPAALKIVGGIGYDTDLTYSRAAPIMGPVYDANKLVMELHWYPWSWGDQVQNWEYDWVCDMRAQSQLHEMGGFLIEVPQQPYSRPLLLTEVGLNVQDFPSNVPHARYFACLANFLRQSQAGFAVWGLQGSYYAREGEWEYEEPYGLLNKDWSGVRNQLFSDALRGMCDA